MTRLAAIACLAALAGAAACGDDASNPRGQCSPTHRLVVQGRVGPTRLDLLRNDPFTGGESGPTFITLLLESGEGAHLIDFTSNSALDVGSLWDAMVLRLQSGAADAGALTVASRPSDVPCDPREGSVCAAFGVDANGDGILFGSEEVIYPVESGELHVTEADGNNFNGDFDITFGPSTSGSEEGSGQGGSVRGCFRMFRDTDRRTLF